MSSQSLWKKTLTQLQKPQQTRKPSSWTQSHKGTIYIMYECQFWKPTFYTHRYANGKRTTSRIFIALLLILQQGIFQVEVWRWLRLKFFILGDKMEVPTTCFLGQIENFWPTIVRQVADSVQTRLPTPSVMNPPFFYTMDTKNT